MSTSERMANIRSHMKLTGPPKEAAQQLIEHLRSQPGCEDIFDEAYLTSPQGTSDSTQRNTNATPARNDPSSPRESHIVVCQPRQDDTRHK